LEIQLTKKEAMIPLTGCHWVQLSKKEVSTPLTSCHRRSN
jgi:hypothetical protein